MREKALIMDYCPNCGADMSSSLADQPLPEGVYYCAENCEQLYYIKEVAITFKKLNDKHEIEAYVIT